MEPNTGLLGTAGDLVGEKKDTSDSRGELVHAELTTLWLLFLFKNITDNNNFSYFGHKGHLINQVTTQKFEKGNFQ